MADQSKKEPMIGKENRPSPIDYDAPLSGMKVRDLLGVLSAHSSEQVKAFPEQFKPEHFKPEFYKPETFKPEQFKPEHFKPEFYKPETFKPEHLKPEYVKPEAFKELLKPEFSKPVEKEFPSDPGDIIQQVAERVVNVLKERGFVK
jgi:hypothetical protein